MKYEIERKYLLGKFPEGIKGLCERVWTSHSWYISEFERLSYRRDQLSGEEQFYHVFKERTDNNSIREEEVQHISKQLLTNGRQQAESHIKKHRFVFTDDSGVQWEVDDFYDLDLVIAECEFIAHSEEEKKQQLQKSSALILPEVLDDVAIMEVTDFREFYNYNLSLLG